MHACTMLTLDGKAESYPIPTDGRGVGGFSFHLLSLFDFRPDDEDRLRELRVLCDRCVRADFADLDDLDEREGREPLELWLDKSVSDRD